MMMSNTWSPSGNFFESELSRVFKKGRFYVVIFMIAMAEISNWPDRWWVAFATITTICDGRTKGVGYDNIDAVDDVDDDDDDKRR